MVDGQHKPQLAKTSLSASRGDLPTTKSEEKPAVYLKDKKIENRQLNSSEFPKAKPGRELSKITRQPSHEKLYEDHVKSQKHWSAEKPGLSVQHNGYQPQKRSSTPLQSTFNNRRYGSQNEINLSVAKPPSKYDSQNETNLPVAKPPTKYDSQNEANLQVAKPPTKSQMEQVQRTVQNNVTPVMEQQQQQQQHVQRRPRQKKEEMSNGLDEQVRR